jgi:hypothetical protein
MGDLQVKTNSRDEPAVAFQRSSFDCPIMLLDEGEKGKPIGAAEPSLDGVFVPERLHSRVERIEPAPDAKVAEIFFESD